MRGTLVACVAMLVTVACSEENAAFPSAAKLLEIPVRATQEMRVEEFQVGVAQAAAAGESWVRNPGQVALRFAQPGSRQIVTSLRGSGEVSTSYAATIITDGHTDDSVRGDRIEASLTVDPDGVWSVIEARRAWRCWENRGHTDFGTEPCT